MFSSNMSKPTRDSLITFFDFLIVIFALASSCGVKYNQAKESNSVRDRVINYDTLLTERWENNRTSRHTFDYASANETAFPRGGGSIDAFSGSSLYPRSTETRSVSTLNGVYQFCLDGQQTGMLDNWHEKSLEEVCSKEDLFRMPVPSAFNDITPLKRVRDHVGWVWYQTNIICPATGSTIDSNHGSDRNVYLLRFDSVNYEAIVWLDGQKLGTHVGGHLPFTFQLSKNDLCFSSGGLSSKRNRLIIAVNNNLTLSTIPSGQTRQIKLSNGKLVNRFKPDFDFFNYAGILRDVRLYTVPDMHISDISTNVKKIIFCDDDQGTRDKSETLNISKLIIPWMTCLPSSDPIKAILSYKLRVDVPDRILSWSKSVDGHLMDVGEADRATNLTIVVSIKDQNELTAKSEKSYSISYELFPSSQNDILSHNRRYSEFEGEIEIDNPKLWMPYQANCSTKNKLFDVLENTMAYNKNDFIEHEQITNERLNYRANLYDIEFALIVTGNQNGGGSNDIRAKDVYNMKIGIKTIELSSENGPFVINRRPVYLKGFGKHEEQLFRGRSMDLATLMKDVYLIKWTGANVIRTSHYPYSEEFLDEMDAHGIMVIDECPAVGVNHFDDKKLSLHQTIMTELIQRDKNRASVIMWSLANEPRSDMKESDKYFKDLVDYVNQLQSFNKLPLTSAIAQEYNTDHLGQYVDVIMINRYFGWYEDVGFTDEIYDKLTADLHNWIKKFQKPILVSEYGADAIAGLHKLPDMIFSEEYQIELLKENFRVFDSFMKINNTKLSNHFIGEMVWNFADFHTHQSLSRMGGNRKGLFTMDRQPKMAAHLTRSRYTSLG